LILRGGKLAHVGLHALQRPGPFLLGRRVALLPLLDLRAAVARHAATDETGQERNESDTEKAEPSNEDRAIVRQGRQGGIRIGRLLVTVDEAAA
jgi:hypothetical protein